MNTIEVTGLTKSYDGSTNAVQNLNFSIPKGEIFGFLGPNGSGKTTTVRILNGILSQTAGEAKILNMDTQKQSLQIHKICGVMTETARCYENLTAEENLLFFGRMHEIYEKELQQRAYDLLKKLELYDVKNKRVKNFSTGMRKRMSLALALIHNPQVLFLDEPTSGLDPENALNVTRLVKEMADEKKVTVFLCTHQLKYAEEICSYYGFINNGKILGVGTFQELLTKKGAKTKLIIRGKNISKDFQYNAENQTYTKEISNDEEAAKIIAQILQNGGSIFEAKQQHWSLEDLYFRYIKD